MFLKKLNILYFKNIEDIQFEFSKTITAFVGNNAVGKTNILDAIYYLSMTKSYFSSSDTQNIQHGKEFFVLSGKYEHEQAAFEVNCSFKKSEGKQITLNQKPYPKISDHIGKIPVVMIAPQDLNLITEYADTRRKFLDAFISKFDKEYLNALIQYHQILQHRNSIIKKGEIAFQQQDLLDVYNAQLS
ncbi:MAG: AAA family ATPase, partial [Bacteroidia bacterium]|nr:AAA family ATPase [Bacteroidia bacterium]